MTPDTPTSRRPDGDLEYSETVVEYVDNRRQRIVLSAVLVLLFLLLCGLGAAVVYLTGGEAAPKEAELPKGLTWVRSIYGWGKTEETSLRAPSDVAFAPDGSIWAVSGGAAIVGFNPDGSLRKLIAPTRGRGEKMVDTLEGITIGRDGTIYVTDSGRQKVIEYAPNGTWLGEWPVQFPIEIVTDRKGKLAVTGQGGVAVLTEDADTVISKWGSRGFGDDQFDLPHGIVFGPDGTLYVSDTQNQRVKAIAPNGKVLWTSGTARRGAAGASATASPFALPAGLTMDGAGRLVLVDPFGFKLFVLDAKNGKVLQTYGEYGEADGFFSYPTGVDYDPGRDWFVVADTANNRLQILTISGSGGNLGSGVARLLARPLWVFCIPLILLLAAVAVLVMRRRRQKRAQAAAEDAAAGME